MVSLLIGGNEDHSEKAANYWGMVCFYGPRLAFTPGVVNESNANRFVPPCREWGKSEDER